MEIMGSESDNFVVSTPYLSETDSRRNRRFPRLVMIWWRQAQRVQKQAHVFYFVFKHPRNPWYAKMIAACTAGYLLSPVQLIPSFIPGIGFLDDLLVLFLGVKLLQKITSVEVLKECRKLADAAEAQRKEEIRSGTALIVPFVIATIWLLGTITASLVIFSHLRR
jgi:uncharacterized membrane protein YkvA (DUF1232 family)